MDKLRFGFFEGFKGENTLLFFGSGSALQSLRDVLSSLQDNAVISLAHDNRFLSIGGIEVIVSLTDESQGSMRCIAPEELAFKWLVSKNEVITFNELIEPIVASKSPCHQYLDQGVDDIQVIVSKDEYEDHKLAHKHSIRHRKELEKSSLCGCFYCLAIFPPSQITDWTDDYKSAICPKCSIDSVIGSASGYPITTEFLQRMHNHWFENNRVT